MYKCNHCDKEFELKQQKTNHERWHANPKHNEIKKEYCCSICGKTFTNFGWKQIHEKYCDGSGLTKKEKILKNRENNKGKTFDEILVQKGTYEKFCQNVSFGMKEAFKEGKFTGSPSTEEGKKRKNEKLRQSTLKRYKEGWDSKCGRAPKYHYESKIAGKITVDGSWELNVAKYLDNNNFRWIRNTKRFDYVNLEGKQSTYKPDFYIFNWSSYLEIKGFETKLDKCKWEQFKEPLIIWKRNDLKELKII
jgi:DNA-directed RNA polymerase subunit RPC12/RpoP